MDVILPFISGTNNFGDAIVAGDFNVNNDNYDDLVVSARTTTDGNGKVYIYYYNSTDWGDGQIDDGPDETLESEEDPSDGIAEFGRSMAVGHFYPGLNDDLVVGEPGHNPTGGPSEDGRINIFDGDNIYNNTGPHIADDIRDSPAWWDHSIDNERFGSSVAAGDFNPSATTYDFDDVIVGAIRNDNDGNNEDFAGRAYVVEADDNAAGGFLSVPPDYDDAPATDIPNPDGSTPTGDEFGNAVWAGDFYGDGVDDFIVCAHYNDSGKGMIAFYDCDGSTIPTTPTDIVNGTQNGEELGTSISGGEFSSDSYYIIVSGAPSYDNATYFDNGRVWVMFIPEFPLHEIPIVLSFMMAIGIVWRKKKKNKN
jgi:hypothetical protein